MKWRYIIHLIFVTFCLILGLILFVISTQQGLNFGLSCLSYLLPGQLHLQPAQGSLLHGFNMKNLHYQDKKYIISATNFSLHWQARALFRGELKLNNLHLEKLHIVLLDKPDSLKYQRYFDLEEIKANSIVKNHRSFLTARWQHLSLHLDKQHIILASHSKLNLFGRISNYQFKLETTIAAPNINHSLWSLQGHGNAQAITLAYLKAKTNKGLLHGSGRFNWGKQGTWQFKLLAQHLDPNLFLPMTPGAINFQLKLAGDHQQMNVQLHHLTGLLGEQTIKGYGTLQLNSSHQVQTDVKLHLGKGHITIHGAWPATAKTPLGWDIQLPQLHDIMLNAHGTVQSKGKITRSGLEPKLELAIHLKDLVWQTIHIGLFKLQGNFNFSPKGQVAGEFYIKDLTQGDNTLTKGDLKIRGLGKLHTISIQLVNPLGQLSSTLNSQYAPLTWLVTLKQLSAQHSVLGSWKTHTHSQFSMNSSGINLQRTCLYQKRSQLCAQFNQQDASTWSMTAVAEHFPLQALSYYLPEGNTINSEAKLNLTLGKKSGRAAANLDILLRPGHLTYQQHKLRINSGYLHGQLNEQGFSSQLDLRFGQQQKINFQFKLPEQKDFSLNNSHQQITGHLDIAMRKIQFLLLNHQDIELKKGDLKIHSQIKGTLASPKIIGHSLLNISKIIIPRLGIAIDDLKLQARGDDLGKITLNLTAKLAQQELKVSAHLVPNNESIDFNMTLQGQNLLVANTSQHRLLISPNLSIKKNKQDLNITGKIDIPQLRLNALDIERQSVQLPPDTVIVDDENQAPSIAHDYALTSDILITLGDKINIAMLGLKAQLTGQVRLIHENKLNQGTGTIHIIKGQYKIYGTQLNIEKGQLNFATSPIDNPSLDIEAIRTITQAPSMQNTNLGNQLAEIDNIQNTRVVLPGQQRSFKVGIHATGRLKQPKLRLFSRPANLSQSDILSYLILGRSMSQASQGNRQTLFSAASALNLAQGELSGLSKSLKSRVHLDEINVASRPLPATLQGLENDARDPTNENTSLILGKALAPNLYINYSVGLLRPINILTIKLLLNSQWSLQSESSSIGNGLDLFYSIEK